MQELNNGTSMKSQRPSRTTTGNLTLLISKEMEEVQTSDAVAPAADVSSSDAVVPEVDTASPSEAPALLHSLSMAANYFCIIMMFTAAKITC